MLCHRGSPLAVGGGTRAANGAPSQRIVPATVVAAPVRYTSFRGRNMAPLRATRPSPAANDTLTTHDCDASAGPLSSSGRYSGADRAVPERPDGAQLPPSPCDVGAVAAKSLCAPLH